MDLDTLRRSVAGAVIPHADARHAAARGALLWNARQPPRRPLAIVRAASARDAQAAVHFAQDRGLSVSARGGGHHWSGIALQEGIMLDLSALKQVAVDAGARLAEAGPGVAGREFARALAAQCLAFPVGHCGTVPLGGYLLGGGFGWNAGAWGVACHSVESVEVVTADGAIRRASAAEEPDIFWAARGAGPAFFGVVTSYRLRLRPLPRAITTGAWTYRLDDIAGVEAWISAALPGLPRHSEAVLALASAPPPLAGASPKVATATVTAFADTGEEAGAVLARLGAGAPEGALAVEPPRPTPFEALFDMMGRLFPEGRRYAADNAWSGAPLRDVLETLAERVRRAPSAESFALVPIMPPSPPGAPPLPDAALSMAGPVYGLCYAVWQDPSGDEANLRWLRETGEALAPLAMGHYVGEADLENPARLRRCFSPAAWDRLSALRAEYDPAGVFRKPS
jgi:FAD/FMN-containing dehydrogenase